MNLKEQQYVCTLARCQTISKAAEELYISPSALSVYISNLEKYLGISLFLRTGRSFVLTPIGEEYVSRARKMLEMKDEFDCLVDHARRKAHPSIRIGIQQRRAISIAPELLKRFMEEYPDVEFFFIAGADSIMDIEKWYHPEYVLPAVTFLAAAREHEEADRSLDEQISYLTQKYQAHILRLHCREMDVASAEIRAAFRAGHAADVRSLVPKEVCQYIEQHGLYQEVNV